VAAAVGAVSATTATKQLLQPIGIFQFNGSRTEKAARFSPAAFLRDVYLRSKKSPEAITGFGAINQGASTTYVFH
jgi:hypothetical protein